MSASGLSVAYGGLRANSDISLSVRGGQVVGLIGPNGAGKTTFIDAVTGFTSYTGRVQLGQRPLDALSAHQRARAGLSRTWQSLELFSDLTAFENLLVATRRMSIKSVLADIVRPGRHRDETNELWALELVGLTEVADRTPKELSLGQEKLLGVARALATRPRVVLLDEPAAGLDARESAVLGTRFRDIVDHDIAVLLIDHDMDLVLRVCDYIYVLDFGKLIAQGTPAQVRDNDDVIAAYLGEEARRAKADAGSVRTADSPEVGR